MGDRNLPLKLKQIEVLSWIRDGCTDGVYEDWAHRIVARALHNRGLVVISGRGTHWHATLTKDGAYYLEHTAYLAEANKAVEKAATRSVASSKPHRKKRERSDSTTAPPSGMEHKSKPRKVGRVDHFLAELSDAAEHRIQVPWADSARYRQLAGVAKRFGKIPEGMQLSFDRSMKDGSVALQITLEPIPAWQTAVLAPIPVQSRLHTPCDLVETLAESETFPVKGPPRKRALRLLDALVTEARSRGMIVSALPSQPIHKHRYASGAPRRDEIQFEVDEDSYRLWFTQATLKEVHEPTARELARARNGYLFPDHDDVPDEQLGLAMDGHGGTFWASSWRDTDEMRLEEHLAQILEEIRLRHESLVARRAAEARQMEDKRKQWQLARERAVPRYEEQFNTDAMRSQAERWAQAQNLKNYAAAVRSTAAEITGEAHLRAIAWAEQIEAHAIEIDPLPSSALPPPIPAPSPGDLKPYMGSRGPYGP